MPREDSKFTVLSDYERARGEPKTDLPMLWLDDIDPVLNARDFVQGVLMEGGGGVVYGESNSGKTFWTTDLALHVAAGKEWNGRRVDQGGVIYCVLEGGDGFRNRVSAWKRAHGAERGLPFAAIPSPINLLDPEADTDRVIRAIKAAEKRMGQRVKLVVIDTLSRALAGGNENASEDMGALVLNMDRIRAETGACVLFVHHSGKDAAKGARGHSSLRAAIDTEIEVTADETSGDRTATVVKQRDMPKGAAFGFRLDAVTLGQNQHGEDVTTCTVEGQAAAAPAPKGKGAALTIEERGWLKDILDFFDDPRQSHQEVRPDPEMPVVRAAKRDQIRAWLVRRGRIGSPVTPVTPPTCHGESTTIPEGEAVTGSVAPSHGLTVADRQNLKRYLNRLKDKGRIGMLGDWIWPLGAAL